MDIRITGKIIARGEKKSGVSNDREWASIEYTIEETDGRYPKRCTFVVFGVDKVNRAMETLHSNTLATVDAEIDAREYKGRWFNQISAFRIYVNGNEVLAPTQQVQQVQQVAPQQKSVETSDPFSSTANADVPF